MQSPAAASIFWPRAAACRACPWRSASGCCARCRSAQSEHARQEPVRGCQGALPLQPYPQALDNHYLGAARTEARLRMNLQATIDDLESETESLRRELAREKAGRLDTEQANRGAREAARAAEEHAAALDAHSASLQRSQGYTYLYIYIFVPSLTNVSFALGVMLRERDGLVGALHQMRQEYDALQQSHASLRHRIEVVSRKAMEADGAARAAVLEGARAGADAAALRKALLREANHSLSVSYRRVVPTYLPGLTRGLPYLPVCRGYPTLPTTLPTYLPYLPTYLLTLPAYLPTSTHTRCPSTNKSSRWGGARGSAGGCARGCRCRRAAKGAPL